MATEAQTCAIGILANRRNAQKSTSPRTLSMSLGLATAKRFAKTSAPEDLFMQNKPNFRKARMNLNFYLTKDYENELCRKFQKNKPNQTQSPKPRHWRTRKDPFEEVWYDVLCWLQRDPDVTAKVLFERLQDEYPGRFPDGQLRTLQRRVREWRKIMARKLVYACIDGNRTY